MDKVIIDGVDVSECKHFGIDNMDLCKINFDNNYFSNGIPCAEKCSNHPDCYYKQLKRAKAELKKYEDMAKKGLEEFKDVGGCWGCGIQESLNQAWAGCKTYRQTLQEIKEIAKDNIIGCFCDKCDLADEILQKIAKVEEENE